MSRLAASWFLLAAACQGPPEPAAPPPPSRPAPPAAAPAVTSQGESDGGPQASGSRLPGSWGLSPPPAAPLDSLLGQRRSAVEAAHQPRTPQDTDGWVAYGDTWTVRYEGDCAVEIRCQLPDGLDCDQAATLTGYTGCAGRGRTERGCIWASRYLTAKFDSAEGSFVVRLRREARKCPALAP